MEVEAQREACLAPSLVSDWDDARQEWVLPLGRFESALEDLLRRLCRRPGRWILIAEDNVHRHHFWQSLAFGDGSLVTETVSNHYLEDSEDRWTPEEDLVSWHWDGSVRNHLEPPTGLTSSTRHVPQLTRLRRELQRR